MKQLPISFTTNNGSLKHSRRRAPQPLMGSAWVTNSVSQMAEVLPPLDWKVGFKLGAVEDTLNLDKFGVYRGPNSLGQRGQNY